MANQEGLALNRRGKAKPAHPPHPSPPPATSKNKNISLGLVSEETKT